MFHIQMFIDRLLNDTEESVTCCVVSLKVLGRMRKCEGKETTGSN